MKKKVSGVGCQHGLWPRATSLIEKKTFSILHLVFFHSMLDVHFE